MNIDDARQAVIKAVVENAMEFHLVEEGEYIPPEFIDFTYDPEKYYLFWYKRKGNFIDADDDTYVAIDKTTGEVKFLDICC